MNCPNCSNPCWREEVDIGVGVQTGPWQCDECGWNEVDDDLAKIEKELGEDKQS